MDSRHVVDTLTNKERLSIRTNAVDWLLLVPNIGVEFDLKNVNYSRWSVGLNLRYNWQTSHTMKPSKVYNIAEVRAEVRNYFRMRQISSYVPRKDKIWERVLSPRRDEVKHPSMTYYRGGFVAYNKYSLKLGNEGQQGNAIIAGVTFGLVKPLYVFGNSSSLDLELGAAVGVAYAKYDTYTHDAFYDFYPKTGNKTTIMPVINELRVGFVYRVGKYPLTKKYRWRYDVDMAYQTAHDNKILAQRRQANIDRFNDSVDAYARKLFWEKYDSITKNLKVKEDSLRSIGQDEKSLKKAAEKAEKEAEKAKKKAAKEAEEAEKKAAKDAEKAEKKAAKEAEEAKEKAEKDDKKEPEKDSEKKAEEPSAEEPSAEEPKQEGGES